MKSLVTFENGAGVLVAPLPARLAMAEAEALIGRQVVTSDQFESYQIGTVAEVLEWPITGGAMAFVLNPGHPTICRLATVIGVVVE